MTIVVEAFGDAALRARLPEDVLGKVLLDALRSLAGVTDAVVTEQHALVAFARALAPEERNATIEAVRIAIERARSSRAGSAAASLHPIAVRYDGEDLAEVARRTGLLQKDVIAVHSTGEYVVAAIGFLPGFAYLRGLDARLVLPRREAPRARITALAVAIAGPYTGVYPCASPGGWHLIGTALGFAPFQADRGASWALGDRVRFVEAPP